jgi:hypothetical protein
MGSRRGPVNERATTRNYGVARERKHTAHGPGRGNAAGQRSESSYLAKVGVAGSNPVVRSRIGTSDQRQCDGPRTGGLSCGPIHQRKTNETSASSVPAAAGTSLVRAATRGQNAGPCRLDADHGARGESGQAGYLSYGQDERPAERAATDPGPRLPQSLPGEPVESSSPWPPAPARRSRSSTGLPPHEVGRRPTGAVPRRSPGPGRPDRQDVRLVRGRARSEVRQDLRALQSAVLPRRPR